MQTRFLENLHRYFAEFPNLGYSDTPWPFKPATLVLVLGTV